LLYRYILDQSSSIFGIFGELYIYIIYTPNLGFAIAVFVREREQGRFRGSTEGARGHSKGARGSTGEHGGALGRSKRAKGGAAREERFWLLKGA